MIELIRVNNKQTEKFKIHYNKAIEIDSMLNDLGNALLEMYGLSMFAITSDTKEKLKTNINARLCIGLLKEDNLFKFNMER